MTSFELHHMACYQSDDRDAERTEWLSVKHEDETEWAQIVICPSCFCTLSRNETCFTHNMCF